MSSYAPRRAEAPPPSELRPCVVRECGVPSLPCFDTWLCEAHGTEANVARDRAGLAFASWREAVVWVGKWVSAKQETETRREA